MHPVLVENTLHSDLEFIYHLFDQSVIYQDKKGYNVWRGYDKHALVKDIKDKNQYKVSIEGQTAIVFSVCYVDKIIWREMESGNAVYLHRIVVNPDFKGQKLFGTILEWAIRHAKSNGLSFIRMDTWADNSTLIQYYQGYGFRFVENIITPNTPELPVHNRNLAVALLELPIK